MIAAMILASFATGVTRAAGVRAEWFQAVAHLYVGALIAIVIASWCFGRALVRLAEFAGEGWVREQMIELYWCATSFKKWSIALAVALSVVEVICFFSLPR